MIEDFGVLALFYTRRRTRGAGEQGRQVSPLSLPFSLSTLSFLNAQCPMPNSIMQCVANTDHSLNEAFFVIGFKFQAQVVNVRFNDVGIAYEVVTPDFL